MGYISDGKALHSRILAGLREAGAGPTHPQELASRLGLGRRQYGEFRKALDELHRDGRLVIGEDKAIHLPTPGGLIVGRFQRHPRGFGFVVPSDPSVTEDLFIPPNAVAGAVTGDLVQAKMARRQVKGQMKTYGRIEKIISRGKDKFVGTLFRAGKQWLVQTDGRILHQPIEVDDVGAKGARASDRVVVRVTEYPEGDRLPRGVVLEVLGAEGEFDTELAVVIREFDLPEQFGEAVDADLDRVLERFARTIGRDLANGKMPRGRLDLRDEMTITIDPEDARDFDDAISITPTGDGVELGVHIADVSAFVRLGAALDKEARERGNSVYLPRKVLPMLPEVLSNGLCSLQEGQDRLTKSAFIRYDGEGKVVSTRFANSVIRSKKRLTYEQATAALKGRGDGLDGAVVGLIKQAEKLARSIHRRRRAEGMLHLDLPEVELEYNENNELIDAHPADQSFSHTIIEMFMVEANEAVARLLDGYAIPLVRRIHPDPSEAAQDQLRDFLKAFGFKLGKSADRSDLQRLIDEVADTPKSFAVSFAILRSLERAEYSIRDVGHYALASRHYCHFTSPIRRYADLLIHRQVQDHLTGRLAGKADQLRGQGPELEEIAEHCSFTGRRADDAERQLTQTLILQLLSGHVGQSFSGVVSGVSSLGAFVQLEKYLIEGMIKVEELGDDWWELNIDGGYILGRHSGKRIKIGDPMAVTIVSVDPIRRQLNLAPTEPLETAVKKGKGKKAKRSSTIKQPRRKAPRKQSGRRR